MPLASQQKGFSLLEVLLVLVIIAMLMAVVASSLSEGPVLRKSAREVASSLRHARSMAILQQQEITWSMNITDKSFWVNGNNADKRTLHQSLETKVNTASTELVSEQQANIRFFPDGSSTGGSVEVTANEQTYKVNVEWITGRVSIL